MNKKGQLQINETIFVVFIFLIILVIGMIVFFQFQTKSIEKIKTENDDDSFYLMLSYIPSMTELRCSKESYEDECIDLTKAKAFSFLMNQDNKNYNGVFGTKKIILNVFNEEILIYDWNPFNKKQPRKITSPVSIYDPTTDKYLIGVLEVYLYA